MKIKYFTIPVVLMLGACAPTFPFGPNEGIAKYKYIGCHVVDNTNTNQSIAFGPFGLETERVFFQQADKNGVFAVDSRPAC